MIRNFFIFFISVISVSFSQELPPVTNYDPVDYGAGNQNWMISQGEDDHLYMANSAGLLQFTGAEWKLYPVPNKSIVRAVDVVGQRIYTGAYMEVGYWMKNQAGMLEYTSLLPKFPGKINDGEQFWRITHLGENVFIQSFQGIYIYHTTTEKIRVLPTPEGFPVSNLFKTGGNIFFLVPGRGLFTIDQAVAKLVVPAEELGQAEVVHVSSKEEGLRLTLRSGEFLFWNGKELTPVYEKLSKELNGASIFSALAIQDKTLLLGTVEDGLYHVDAQGNIIEHFEQENGLQNNTVLCLFSDDQNNIWTGLDNGLSVLNLQSSFQLFKDPVGRIGTVYTTIQTSEYLYLGTNQGLYYRQRGKENFKFIKGTNGQVWSLQKVDGFLLAGHNNGTYLIRDETAEKISDRLGTWIVKKLKTRENYYVQGHYNGISFLKKQGNTLRELPMVQDFPHSSKTIISEEDGDLWIGNEHKGVFRLRLNEKLNAVSASENYAFENEVGITSGIFEFQDTLFFSTKEKVFAFDEKNNVFRVENRIAEVLHDTQRSTGMLIKEGEGLWAFSANALLNIKNSQFQKGLSFEKIYVPRELRSIPTGYENVSKLEGDQYLLGLVDGYLVFQQKGTGFLEQYEVNINEVSIAALDETAVPVSLEPEGEFEFRSNNLGMEFSVPEYKKFLIPLYSYRLNGLSSKWSEWSSTSEASFANLAAGDYIFEVRAKVGDRMLDSDSYVFTILRPWYYSNLAIAAYLLLFLLIVILVHLLYRNVHEKRMKENERDLRMKNLEAEQKIIRLQKEQLEKEMEGKNKELAVSTMSLVKKNEFLTSLKRKLQQGEDDSRIRSVLQTIDNDIKDEDNWNFFQQAFSNADKDFFKKVKARHPDLTSNDLKLCAYLRLNLSSKEIAPLLNISVKSVEIKRYRLRKKMQLSREEGLIDYILSI